MIKHSDEIMSRPKRTWFISENEKKKIKGNWRMIMFLIYLDASKERLENEQNIVENAHKKEKVSKKLLPVVKHPPTRRVSILPPKLFLYFQEKRKKENQADMLTPKQYQLAKKRTAKLSQLKNQTPKKAKEPPKKKQKVEEPSAPRKSPRKQPGSFKSKKKYELIFFLFTSSGTRDVDVCTK